MVARLALRPSFDREPALWWEPGFTYADPAGVAWAAGITVDSGPALPNGGLASSVRPAHGQSPTWMTVGVAGQSTLCSLDLRACPANPPSLDSGHNAALRAGQQQTCC